MILLIFNSKSNYKSDSKETKENKERVKEYTRRGIWSNGYSMGNGENKRSFDVQFELGELESTSTKSKVEVISKCGSIAEYSFLKSAIIAAKPVSNALASWQLTIA